MSKSKKWCIGSIASIIVILAVIAITVFIIDPFFNFRQPSDNMSYLLKDRAYQNPGIVRNFEYDTLITGSSMTMNFKPSYFEEVLGVNAVKVPHNGAGTVNMKEFIELALQNNPKLETVYVGLDIFTLRKDNRNETAMELPMYLYDNNRSNDVSYILNKDALYYVAQSLRMTAGEIQTTTLDDYLSWHTPSSVYSQYRVAAPLFSALDSRGSNVTLTSSVNQVSALPVEDLSVNILLPLLNEYPDVDFVFFFTPCSIMYWYGANMDNDLMALKTAVETLIAFDNASVFFFLNNADIVTNLYNYSDAWHYRPDINEFMVECFADGQHRLTSDNYIAELEKLCDMVSNFDFGIFTWAGNPFIREYDYHRYIDKLQNERYSVFITAGADISLTDSMVFRDLQDVLGLDIVDIESEISIDGVKYTSNQAGINIVVYDTELQRVIDNIAVDANSGAISRQ